MILWLSLAVASSPTWSQGRTTMWSSDTHTSAFLESPDGTVQLSASFVERVRPDGEVVVDRLPYDPEGIFRQAATPCDIDNDGHEDALNVSGGGATRLVDVDSGAVLLDLVPPSVITGNGRVEDLGCVDLDDDGQLDIIGLYPGPSKEVWIWDTAGVLQYQLPTTAGALGLHTAQLDNDPALELVMPDGRIVDGSTFADDGALPPMDSVQFMDVDADGTDEYLMQSGSTFSLQGDVGLIAEVGPAGDAIVGDFDQDGSFEIVYDAAVASGQWTTHHVLDVTTGVERHAPEPGRVCEDGWVRHDHDGDGIVQLFCDSAGEAAAVFDPVLGQRVRYRNHAHDAVPHAGDIDGDGVAEVMWTGGERLTIRDAHGEWLDMLGTLEVQPKATLVDVDGDGDMEIVHDYRVWDWSPATGFVALPNLYIRSSTRRCTIAYGDFDGNGYPNVLFDDCFSGPIQLLDLRTGASLNMGGYTSALVWDMNRDGRREVIGLRFNVADVLTPQGTVLGTVGHAPHVVSTPNGEVLLTGDFGELVVSRWQRGAMRELFRRSPPGSSSQLTPIGYNNGVAWYTSRNDVHRWDLATNTVDVFDEYSDEVILVEGVMWANGINRAIGAL